MPNRLEGSSVSHSVRGAAKCEKKKECEKKSVAKAAPVAPAPVAAPAPEAPKKKVIPEEMNSRPVESYFRVLRS